MTEITPKLLQKKKFIQIKETTWRKLLFKKTYIYLFYQDGKWEAELRLVDSKDFVLDGRVFSKDEFDGKTIGSLNYVCLRITGDVVF